ncbi:MAG: ATP-dependent Clp protease proteolytic subunit [Pseudomonadales bacterium]
MTTNNGIEEAAEAVQQSQFLERSLFERRTLTLFGEIDTDVARRTTEKLLALAYAGDDPITLFIGSPGGHVESGDSIYDMIQFIKPVVRTVGTGWVGSIATHIYLAAQREQRFCLPNTRFLIHQPAGGMGGTASDVEIHAREIVKTRARINRVIAERTGQPLERIERDTDRDFWMSAEESVEYGIVGRVIRSMADLG